MKKVLIGLVVLFVGLQQSEARAQNVIETGVSVLNVGVGVAPDAFPISASFDYGIVGNLFDSKSALTLGGVAGTKFGSYHSGFYVGPRVGFHYHFIPELDLYATSMVGYGGYFFKGIDNKTKFSANYEWGTHVGARYFFTSKVGVFAEVGYGYSYMNLGASFKF